LPKQENAVCVLADTTSLNTGTHGGIFRKLELHYQRQGKDVLALECLIHINELLLGIFKVICLIFVYTVQVSN